MTELQQSMAEHPFCKGLTVRHVEALAEFAMETRFEAGQVIFREGDVANRFYLIVEGKVALEAPRREGEPVPIATIGAGDVLGWSWLFPPYYWNFDARALEPVRALFFYGTRLRERCESDRDLGYELMKRMAMVMLQRLQATRRQLLEKG
jgi:CRP-like cAMP-binding protein